MIVNIDEKGYLIYTMKEQGNNSSAKVSHNGKHWTSLYNVNTWEPGVFGCEEVT